MEELAAVSKGTCWVCVSLESQAGVRIYSALVGGVMDCVHGGFLEGLSNIYMLSIYSVFLLESYIFTPEAVSEERLFS